MPGRKPIPLALVEDDVLLRSLLSRCIELQAEYELVTVCGTDSLDDGPAPERPAAVLLGLHPFGAAQVRGLQALAWFKEQWGGTPILAIMWSLEAPLLKQAMYHGCTGFVCRADTDYQDLCAGVRQLLTTGSCYPPQAMVVMAQGPPPETDLQLIERVCTHIELKILDHMCAPDEPTWEKVAERVFLTRDTVEWHATRMYKALKVKGKPGLMALGRANGFGKGRWA